MFQLTITNKEEEKKQESDVYYSYKSSFYSTVLCSITADFLVISKH